MSQNLSLSPDLERSDDGEIMAEARVPATIKENSAPPCFYSNIFDRKIDFPQGGIGVWIIRGSRPVSRILSAPLRGWVIIHLARASPPKSCSQPGSCDGTGRPDSFPIRPCSGWGFPSLRLATELVMLLPHRFSFPRGYARGFSFLWHFPSDHSALVLRGILPFGVRTFLSDFSERLPSLLPFKI